ncbi:MAG: glycosyltransferase [Nitrospirae bacterium]|nr:glycosyltransferase [Nitrospirota bacterium]
MSTGIPKEPKYKIMDQGSSERGIKRVLVLSHMFPHEGQANLGCFVSEQVKALREFGGIDARVISCQPFLRDVTVYSLPFYWMQALYSYRRQVHEAEWFLHDGIPTLFVPYLVGFPFEFHSMAYLQAVRMIAARIKKVFDFELVHAHTGYLDGIAGRYLARRFKVPFVITEHTGPFSLLTDRPVVRAITLKSMAAADRIICVSPALEGQVKKWLPAKIHDRFAVIPNGVNIELFHPANADRKGIPHKTLNLLSVMSLDENKNPFCLMKAFRILRGKGHDCRLTIAGDGPLMSELREWITDNGYDDRIDLLGWQNRETIARLMQEIRGGKLQL